MSLSDAHRQQLLSRYAIPEQRINELEKSGEVCSLSPSQVRNHLGRTDIDSSGILFRYPNGATTIRLDVPFISDSKAQKYVRRAGEPNSLFNPGVDLAQVDWNGKKVALLYDSDITPGHRAYGAFPRLAEQLYRLGAEEVRILSLPTVAQGQKTSHFQRFSEKIFPYTMIKSIWR